MVFTKIAEIDSIPRNGIKYLVIEDHEVMIIHFENEFYCYNARCTHAGAPLFEGELEKDVIVCPWHNAKFSIIDGSVIDGPAKEPLKAFPVEIKDNFLYIDTKEF